MGKLELLSPAGDAERLNMAVRYGADPVAAYERCVAEFVD